MVFEIIRWVSLALLWVVMGLNVAVMIRGVRLNKRMKVSVAMMEECVSFVEGLPRVVYCRECVYRKDAKANDKGFLICPASGMEITMDDYCSYGELPKEVPDEG